MVVAGGGGSSRVVAVVVVAMVAATVMGQAGYSRILCAMARVIPAHCFPHPAAAPTTGLGPALDSFCARLFWLHQRCEAGSHSLAQWTAAGVYVHCLVRVCLSKGERHFQRSLHKACRSGAISGSEDAPPVSRLAENRVIDFAEARTVGEGVVAFLDDADPGLDAGQPPA